MIDKAFIDRAEELGIKDLLVAFAESLTSVRTSRPATKYIQSTQPDYLVTTLYAKSCTCDAMQPRADKNGLTMPEQPHDSTCAWARFSALFANEKTQAEEEVLVASFRRWAKLVDKNPDDQPYRAVTVARRFLEKDKEPTL